VTGFANTDAALIGVDLSFTYRPSERWTIPVSFFWVRGEDRERDVPLPEIPPFELNLAGRWSFQGRVSGWIELGGRFVAEATRIDPAFPENETPRFSVWHLRGRFGVTRYLSIVAGIENLLNRDYWEHLTREAAANLPGFEQGDELPQPGRHLTIALIFDF
jgi:iron complex outermembrane receptor protein